MPWIPHFEEIDTTEKQDPVYDTFTISWSNIKTQTKSKCLKAKDGKWSIPVATEI